MSKFIKRVVLGYCVAGLWMFLSADTRVANADVVYLENGATISGKVVNRGANRVHFNISGIPTSYELNEVSKIEADDGTIIYTLEEGFADVLADNQVPFKDVTTIPLSGFMSDSDKNMFEGMTKQQLVQKFLDVYGTKDLMEANLAAMMSSMNAEQRQYMQSLVKVDDILNLLFPVYDKAFTRQDLQIYIQFYSSVEGAKLVRAIPILMEESAVVIAEYVKQKLPKDLN